MEEMNQVISSNNAPMLTFEQMNQIISNTVYAQNIVSVQLENLSGQLGGVVKELSGLRKDYSDLTQRMNDLELEEECTTYQITIINETAKKRCSEILGGHKNIYYRTFMKKIYKEARLYAGLGHCMSATKKKDYDRVINFLESWIPRCGIQNLKNQVDDARYIRYGEGQYPYNLINL